MTMTIIIDFLNRDGSHSTLDIEGTMYPQSGEQLRHNGDLYIVGVVRHDVDSGEIRIFANPA